MRVCSLSLSFSLSLFLSLSLSRRVKRAVRRKKFRNSDAFFFQETYLGFCIQLRVEVKKEKALNDKVTLLLRVVGTTL